MTHPISPAAALLILQAGCACNSLDASLRGLEALNRASPDAQVRDKKLQPQLAELRKLAARVLPRMLAQCGAAEADTLNGVSNASEAVTRALCALDGAGLAAVVSYAEGLALAGPSDATPA